MAGGETPRQSHASIRLRFDAEDWRTSLVFSTHYQFWLSSLLGITCDGGVRMPPWGRFARQCSVSLRSQVRFLLRDGFGSRILHRSEFGAPDHQPYLFAHACLQRLWIPTVSAGQWCEDCAWCCSPYHLSQLALGVVGAGSRRVRRLRIREALCCIHHDLPGRRPASASQRDQEKMYG